MHHLDRRAFLSSTLGGLAALAAGTPSWGQEPAAGAGKAVPTPDTLFLTWKRDPTTTMLVQWVGPAEAGGLSIHYAEEKGAGLWRSVATTQRPFPMTDQQLFRAELSGLTPGAEYKFTIGGNPAVHKFRTMPAKATDTFSFISGGDCGVNEHVVANNILAAKQEPMFALIGGDVAYDNGRKVEDSLGFLRNYSRTMIDPKGRMIPMVVGIGNHEVNGSYGKSREAAPFYLALHDGLYPEKTFATLDFGDYLSLVLLDTGHIAPIDGEQTDWLGKALAERTERPHLIAVNHVPAYPSYRVFETEGDKVGTGALNRECWVPLFEKYNVDIVLEHHDHTFKRTHPMKEGRVNANGIVYLGDGSWGKLRAPKSPEERPYLVKSSGTYHMTLHRLEGEQRFHVAIEENGHIADICTTRKRPRRVVGRS